MTCRRPLLPPLLLLGVLCLAAGSPAALSRHRRGVHFDTLPGGIPLSTLFALCQVDDQIDDIGPCLADLLGGAIDKARPFFATGIDVRGDNVVLEPFRLDDVEAKPGKTFQTSVTDLKLHGISTLDINAITFSSDELALNLTFSNVTATGDVTVNFWLLSANPLVHLELSNLTVLVRANWKLDINPEDPTRLDIVLHNSVVNFELSDLNVSFQRLGSVGTFMQNLVNNNSKTLVKFLIPELERSVSKKLNRKLNRIKIVD